VGANKLGCFDETTDTFVFMSPGNMHKHYRGISHADLGPNNAAPVSYVLFGWHVNAVMDDRGILHAETSASVLRTRALGIEHNGTWIRGRRTRKRDSYPCQQRSPPRIQ
jgi:hypothetical protein